MWIGVLHHVVNVHSWILPYSSSNKCEHGPLTSAREKGWLEKDSPAHVSLRSIVLDKRLLNNIPYYLNCRFISFVNSQFKVFLTVSQIKIYFCIDIHSKVILEQLLRSFYDANPSFNHVLFQKMILFFTIENLLLLQKYSRVGKLPEPHFDVRIEATFIHATCLPMSKSLGCIGP